MDTALIGIVGGLILLFFVYKQINKFINSDKWQPLEDFNFKSEWKKILINKVPFYSNLLNNEKELFEHKILEFLKNVQIIGVKTQINDTDKLLVAASAIIPIFKFPKWQYLNLDEVLIYPNEFNHNFDTEGEDRKILGMVGTGIMDGKMILSKKSLHHGFQNESDKKNTAIHEFIHLIDMADGNVDGVPELLLEKQYTIPWLDLIRKNIENISKEDSDINPYGATNKAEFFAVISEYFFERPKLLQKKHPELYKLLEEIFDNDLSKRKKNIKKKRTGRNAPCPCNSGKKHKDCCAKL